MVYIPEKIQIFRNQGIREAAILARCNNECLVEYRMPNGTTALNITLSSNYDFYYAIPYNRVPVRMLRILVENRIQWIGHPQKSCHADNPEKVLNNKKRSLYANTRRERTDSPRHNCIHKTGTRNIR